MFSTTLHLCLDCTLAVAGYDAHELGRVLPLATVQFIERVGLNISAGSLDQHTGDCISDEDGQIYPTDDCQCDYISFSWSPCDGCGSKLGGERQAHTLWYTLDAPDEDDTATALDLTPLTPAVIESAIARGVLAPAARTMPLSEVLAQHAGANALTLSAALAEIVGA